MRRDGRGGHREAHAAERQVPDRHRLNRGGDRQANRALHTIALVRVRHDPRTHDYVARRTHEGLKTKDIFRCLKRFVAREVYRHLTSASSGTLSASPAA
ncbi:transposase [Streptomyces atratus]|uniref:transposase n=1 Tax=Streptomyces atratus TaxID=1893 RepID=UPI00386DE3EB